MNCDLRVQALLLSEVRSGGIVCVLEFELEGREVSRVSHHNQS